jgi:hypothetical protein
MEDQEATQDREARIRHAGEHRHPATPGDR